MSSELLYQILLIVGIVAIVFLIVNLWRLWGILERVDNISRIIDSRTRELDKHLSNTENVIETYKEVFKGFLLSLGTAKFIKEKIGDLTGKKEDKESKKEKND